MSRVKTDRHRYAFLADRTTLRETYLGDGTIKTASVLNYISKQELSKIPILGTNGMSVG